MPRFEGPAQGLQQEIVLAAVVADGAPYPSAAGSEESAASDVYESVGSAAFVAAVSEFAYTAAALQTLVYWVLVQRHGTWACVPDDPFHALASSPDSCHYG